jgi:hypothetical protein
MSRGPADVRNHLERLRRGHAILRDLRRGELRTLSVDEARLQYDRLVRAGQTQSHDRGPELERRAIEEHRVLPVEVTGAGPAIRRWLAEFARLTDDREIVARCQLGQSGRHRSSWYCSRNAGPYFD